MKIIVLLLCLWGVCAQPKKGLYGLSPNVQLLFIDPTTFTSTPIGDPIPKELQAQQLSAIDQKHGLLYLIGFNSSTQITQLISISLENGKVKDEITLPFAAQGFVGIGQAVAYDPSTDEAFVLGPDPKYPQNHAIFGVNIQQRTVNHITTIPFGTSVIGVGAAYVPDTRTFWIPVGVNRSGGPAIDMYGVDVSTGHYRDAASPYEIGPLAYDPQFQPPSIRGLGLDPSQNHDRCVVQMDGQTGAMTRVSDFVDNSLWLVVASEFALDSTTSTGYAILSTKGNQDNFHVVAVNLWTGVAKGSSGSCSAQRNTCPWSLHYYVG